MTRLGKFANTSCFQLHLRKLGLMFEVLKRLERLEQLELLCIVVATHRIMRSRRLIERLLDIQARAPISATRVGVAYFDLVHLG